MHETYLTYLNNKSSMLSFVAAGVWDIYAELVLEHLVLVLGSLGLCFGTVGLGIDQLGLDTISDYITVQVNKMG